MNFKRSLIKFAAAAAITTALWSGSAMAMSITTDLRAISVSGGGTVVDGKDVTNLQAGSVLTMQVWAQIVNSAATNGTFGVGRLMGSIKTNSVTATTMFTSGAISTMSLNSPWGTGAPSVGTQGELSSPTDGISDLGSNATTTNTSFVIFNTSQTNSQGQQVGASWFATNIVPLGDTVNAITNGYEFLMGTVTLTISGVNNSNTTGATVNWVQPAYTAPATKGQIAIWTAGDGNSNNGSGQFANMAVGSAISLSAVPEPTTFAMLIGGIGMLLGIRRRRA